MYPTLFRSIISPIAEYSKKTSIQRYLRWLNKTQWMKPEELKELQNKKLRALIKHAYENVPYYNNLFKKLNLLPKDIKSKSDLTKLPYLTKDIISKNFRELQAVNIDKSQILEAHSSGTTGEPLKFYLTRDAYSYGWAQTFRCWGWSGYKLGDPYIKISPESRKNWSEKFQDRMMNCMFISTKDINEKIAWNKLQMMKKFRPKIIRSYVSPMYLLAKYAEKFDIKIQPSAVMTTGEKLFSHYRKLIESQFTCDVFDCYGGESTPLAFECERHEGYHLCEETSIVEILKDGLPASSQELGEIAFTNLDNYAMPFIRYKLEDVGRLSDDFCPCGRGLSLMSSIEGRSSDMVITPDKNVLVVNFFTNLFKDIEGISQFQVIQESIDEINIKILKNEKFDETCIEYIKSQIKMYSGEEMYINIEYVESIPLTKSGKRRFVVSKVPLDTLWK